MIIDMQKRFTSVVLMSLIVAKYTQLHFLDTLHSIFILQTSQIPYKKSLHPKSI
jgi:hypothetical protein